MVLHFRGCSGEPNRLARGYHSGETSDLAWFIDHLRRREPTTPIAAVGYSLGSNVLLKWLGERGAGAPLPAAVAVSVPFVLQEATDRFCRGFSRLYQWPLLRSLKRGYRRKFACMPSPLSVDPARLNRFWDFDHTSRRRCTALKAPRITTPVQARQYLKNLRILLLVIHAKDDPFMIEVVIPQSHELAPSITLEGHARRARGIRLREMAMACWRTGS